MMSSTTGPGDIRFLSICLFGILRSIQARIMFGLRSSLEMFVNQGLSCTIIGEHHLTGTPFGISSNTSPTMPCTNHAVNDACRYIFPGSSQNWTIFGGHFYKFYGLFLM